MTDERDRGLVRRAFADPLGSTRKRWGVDDEFKVQAVKALRVALRWSLENADHRSVRGVVDTLARIEAQNQADEHLAEKNARLDAGKPTEGVAIQPIVYRGVEDKDL